MCSNDSNIVPMCETLSISIPSKLDQIKQVEQFVERLKETWNLPEDVYGNAMITVTEAVNNAIKHGNEQDPGKSVELEAVYSTQRLKVKVSDEGSGFDPDELSNPLEEDNLLKDSGRGVFIMRQMADDVTFEDNGSTVILTYTL